ncbi:hypothetical protein HXX76_010932 [Chlamydomonas incerta]|uniref:Uncharacterized protein n=1 Tax=Chlamydomonas incerta TaxID=51695 RepID=A0A835VRT6_CHLIN|nr:hypothetical protein HXX76_010932 [Chlamydomonas incerta]|eukprot:KAG2423164.1 hypothetical protein HXX76_010932 [Chlamydomonas incerta]
MHCDTDAQLAYWQDAPRAERPWPGAAFVGHWDRPEPWRSLSLAQRRRLLLLAASSGHPASLEVTIRRCGVAEPPVQLSDSFVGECYFRGALAVGDLQCADVLWSAGFRHHDHENTAAPAAVMGGLEACQWLAARHAGVPGSARRCVLELAECAAFAGREDQLDWLLEQQGLAASELPHLTYCAALGGHVGTMQRLRARAGGAWPGGADMWLLRALVRSVAPLPVVEAAAAQLLGDVGVAAAVAAGTVVLRARLLLAAALSYSHDWAAKVGWQALAPPTVDELEGLNNDYDVMSVVFLNSCRKGLPADFGQRMLRLLDVPGFEHLQFFMVAEAVHHADVPAVRLLVARSSDAREDAIRHISSELKQGKVRLPACEPLLHELGLELSWQHMEAAWKQFKVEEAAWMAMELVARGRLPDVTQGQFKQLVNSLLERGDDVATVLGCLGVRDSRTNGAYRAFMRSLDAAHGLASLAVGGSVVALEDYVGRMAALGVALRPLEPGMLRKAAANQAALEWLRGRGLLLAQQGV